MDKKNLILGGVLIAMIALAYAYQGPIRSWQENQGKASPVLKNIKMEELSQVTLTNGGKETVLERDGQKWRVKGTKGFFVKDADAVEMESAIKAMAEKNPELVSENKDKKADFEVDSDKGTTVVLRAGDKDVANFIVGKMSPDYMGSYFSMADSDITYLLKENLVSAFAKEGWYDRTIFSSAKENIEKIRFQYPNREFTIEKKDGKWQGTLPKSFEVKDDKLEKVLEIMSGLEAVKIPEQTFDGTGLEKHSIIVQATGNGVDNTIMVGSKNKEGNYFVKNGISDNIYLITQAEKDALDRTMSSFK